MPSFPILYPHLGTESDPDPDGFEIDSDVSDEEVRFLSAQLQSTRTERTQRNLAVTTLVLQKLHFQRWVR